MPNLALAVTGCVQAEETSRLVSELLDHPELPQVEIAVVATTAALRFIDRGELERMTGRPVPATFDDGLGSYTVPHVELGEWADLLIVYPASANTIAKCAHGICDNLLTTLVLAARCPVYFAPSMNRTMYESPVLQRNLELLKEAGYRLVPRTVAEVRTRASGRTTRQPACTMETVSALCRFVFAESTPAGDSETPV